MSYKKAGGVGEYFMPEGVTRVNTKKCQHCGKMVDIPVMRDFHHYMDLCRVCMGAMCNECAGPPKNGECTPLMKQIERQEEEYYRQQQNRKLMGY